MKILESSAVFLFKCGVSLIQTTLFLMLPTICCVLLIPTLGIRVVCVLLFVHFSLQVNSQEA